MFDIELYDNADTDITNAPVDDQVTLEFGETVRRIQPMRNFIETHGTAETIRDYKTSIRELNNQAAKDGTVSKAQMLQNEILVQSWIYQSPPESLTGQFGLHPLLEQFKESGLAKLAQGTGEVTIANPERATTWRNIGTKGVGEAMQNLWAAQTYST